jgi:excisionase family DNA binding protein
MKPQKTAKPAEAALQPEPRPTAVLGQPVAPLSPGEVLNLAEAAAYLRLSEADLLRLVEEQGLPGRQLGKEWRFLKAAIQDWLRAGPAPKPSKAAQLAVVGSWKDDPLVAEELKETYRQRGRPLAEDEP